MNEVIEPDSKFDSKITGISFSNSKGNCVMLIHMTSNKEMKALVGKLKSLRGIYQMDQSRQNFTVTSDDESHGVVITGNIFNAFNLLNDIEDRVISSELQKNILANKKIMSILDSSKNYIIPEDNEKTVDVSIGSTRGSLFNSKAQDFASIQQKYEAALSTLSPEQIQEVVVSLSRLLAQKGIKIDVVCDGSINQLSP